MVRNKKEHVDIATLQPDELNELKKVVQEFINRLQNVDNEISTLKEDRKSLLEEYKEKLDVKMFQTALKVVQIESKVERKGSYDAFIEVLRTMDGYSEAVESERISD
jgi:uncharacterized protein (UPF0335 family)